MSKILPLWIQQQFYSSSIWTSSALQTGSRRWVWRVSISTRRNSPSSESRLLLPSKATEPVSGHRTHRSFWPTFCIMQAHCVLSLLQQSRSLFWFLCTLNPVRPSRRSINSTTSLRKSARNGTTRWGKGIWQEGHYVHEVKSAVNSAEQNHPTPGGLDLHPTSPVPPDTTHFGLLFSFDWEISRHCSVFNLQASSYLCSVRL